VLCLLSGGVSTRRLEVRAASRSDDSPGPVAGRCGVCSPCSLGTGASRLLARRRISGSHEFLAHEERDRPASTFSLVVGL